MADWTKKITKAVGDDLEAGETLLSGIFLSARRRGARR